MRETKSTGGRLRPAVPGDGYPWSREREAVDALERLDLDRCRAGLRSVAREVRLPTGTPVAVAALLLGDLLDLFDRRLQPSAAWEASRLQRVARARRLGTASDLEELRRAFLTEADGLLAPLATVASLSPSVLRARAYLERNYSRRVTLREVAGAVHLSPNYLSTLFRRETGMTVTDYLRKRRMDLAERLLLDGRHTISEVAYRVGYRNYRDFHRNFVRARGRSPRAFQRLSQAGRRAASDGT